jgi:outer membrane protein TolC
MGVGNKSQIAAARSRATSADLELLVTLDRIRAEVAAAQAKTFARFARIGSCELAIEAATQAFAEDMTRVLGGAGLPLEAIDSLRLLAQSRLDYLDAILAYNQAQFELFVALGKPPSEILIRPAEPIEEPNDQTRRVPATSDSRLGRIKLVGHVAGETDGEIASERRARKMKRGKLDSRQAGDVAALRGLMRSDVLPPATEQRLIDLPTALQLAESANPTIALGRQAIVEAVAIQTGARGLLLPTLNAGSNYHLHQGVLQTSFGQIRNLNEQSIYVGGGAKTLAAETVAIPAVRIFSHLGDALFAPLSAGQTVCARTYDAAAIDNNTLLTVVQRYLELAMAEASLDAVHQGEDGFRSIVAATAAFAQTGQGREGDYQRARADALLLHALEQSLQERVAVKSADLSRVLHLDPAIRLRTQPGPLEMVQLIDPDYSVEALVDLAQTARPELAARTAEIAAADYRVRQEVTRPFLPVVSVGFSGGAFGGGSNRQDLGVPSFFQTFGGRTDFDVMAVWSLQNLGFGNNAIQKRTCAERDQAIAARGRMANRITREVGDAYAQAETHKQRVALAEQRLRSAVAGAREELARTHGGEGLPIEALNSVRLLSEAGLALVEAIGGYDLAQFELFVAIGQTPHGALPDPRKSQSEAAPVKGSK